MFASDPVHYEHEMEDGQQAVLWGSLGWIDILPRGAFLPLWEILIPQLKKTHPTLHRDTNILTLFELEYPLGIQDIELTISKRNVEMDPDTIIDLYWRLMEKRALGEVDQNPYLWVVSHIKALVNMKTQRDPFHSFPRYVRGIEQIFNLSVQEFGTRLKQVWTKMGPLLETYEGKKKHGEGKAPKHHMVVSSSDGKTFHLVLEGGEEKDITKEGLQILLWQGIYHTLLGNC